MGLAAEEQTAAAMPTAVLPRPKVVLERGQRGVSLLMQIRTGERDSSQKEVSVLTALAKLRKLFGECHAFFSRRSCSAHALTALHSYGKFLVVIASTNRLRKRSIALTEQVHDAGIQQQVGDIQEGFVEENVVLWPQQSP